MLAHACPVLKEGTYGTQDNDRLLICSSRTSEPFGLGDPMYVRWSRTMTRHAACSCGQLQLSIEGEPSRNAMCHCLACQRRTGAVISNQARYRNDQVTITGKSTQWSRTADSGNAMTFHFCPRCGSTVFWENAGFPGHLSVAIGNFADPSFPAPTLAVWEESRHPWVNLPPDTPPKRAVKQS